jgi:hypothetical protein
MVFEYWVFPWMPGGMESKGAVVAEEGSDFLTADSAESADGVRLWGRLFLIRGIRDIRGLWFLNIGFFRGCRMGWSRKVRWLSKKEAVF